MKLIPRVRKLTPATASTSAEKSTNAPKGPTYWIPLIRARAIENQVYFIAPAPTGDKYAGEVSWGETVIVDPWGTVLAKAPDDDEAVIYADIETERQQKIRKMIPVLRNARLWQKNH